MLLLVSLCLYSGVVLAASLIFLVRVAALPFSIDKAIAYPRGPGESRKDPKWSQRGRNGGGVGYELAGKS